MRTGLCKGRVCVHINRHNRGKKGRKKITSCKAPVKFWISPAYRISRTVRMSQLHDEEEEGKMKRPEVRDEDLIQARDNLASGTEVKSKTFQVMEECERVGKVAPSVFSNVRSGGETVFNKPSRKK
ncbi:musculoskeletal embryonic nuclear protein 1a [Hoplias malabaricus]|uniref:musculoskeletal embryonic nuclear protein 1a n=1 Tax=Hoplias malabaricus TaxID=27720 RepID=UPI00346201B9